jgi:hypothetical protein
MWYVQGQIVSSKGSVLYNIPLVICIVHVVFIFVYMRMSSGGRTCCVSRVGCVLVVGEGGVHRLHIILHIIWSLVVWVSSSHRCVHAAWSAVLPIVCIPVLFPLFVWCHVSVRNTVA